MIVSKPEFIPIRLVPSESGLRLSGKYRRGNFSLISLQLDAEQAPKAGRSQERPAGTG